MKMKFWTLLIGATLGASQPGPQSCGVGEPSPKLLDIARSMRDNPASMKRDHNTSLVIPTYLHVVESADREGTVTPQMLEDQVRDMLDLYVASAVRTRGGGEIVAKTRKSDTDGRP